MIRVVLVALAFIGGFFIVLMPLSFGLLGACVGLLAHVLGIVVCGLCLAAGRQGGAYVLAIFALVLEVAGLPMQIGGALFTGPVGSAIAGGLCKAGGWLCFILYLKGLARYLDEESDERLADGMQRSTILLMTEYGLILGVVIAIALLRGAGLHWIVTIMMLVLMVVAILWFTVHCGMYTWNYLQLLSELRITLANRSVGMNERRDPEEDDQEVVEPEVVEEETSEEEGDLRERLHSGRRRSSAMPTWIWIAGAVGMGCVVLCAGGLGAYHLMPNLASSVLGTKDPRERVAKAKYDQLVKANGPDRITWIEVRGVRSDQQGAVLKIYERLTEAARVASGGFRHETKMESVAGDETLYVFLFDGPDLHAMAQNVAFGKASVDTWRKRLTIDVTAEEVATLNEQGASENRLPPPLRPLEPRTPARDAGRDPAARERSRTYDRLTKQLQYGTPDMRQRSAEELLELPPNEQRAEVASALEKLLNENDSGLRNAAARCLGAWGSHANGPALAKLVDHAESTTRWTAMGALGRLKYDPAADPIAKRLSVVADHEKASDALIKMGPAAEAAVLKHAEKADSLVQIRAGKILLEIGTSASIPELEGWKKSDSTFVRRQAEEAIAAITAREKK